MTLFSSGQFWMWFWVAIMAIMVVWGICTALFWFDSVRNLNYLSVAALWLACGAGFQSTLGMRKADPEDPM